MHGEDEVSPLGVGVAVRSGARIRGRARRPLSGAQRELVAQHVGLVRLHLRRRVHLPQTATQGREAEDLYQEGCLGLMRAAITYDALRHGAFEPYALARIRRAVHDAIYEGFATVRVPVRTIARRKAAARRAQVTGNVDSRSAPWARREDLAAVTSIRRGNRCSASPADLHEGAVGSDADVETVGQHLRAKHRIALAAAVDRVARQCRRRGVRPVLEAIATERLAIPSEDAQTALRAIGRRFNVSIGRTEAWQRGIEREVRDVLAADAEFAVLKRASLESEGGGDCTLDADLVAELTQARCHDLRCALAARDPLGRAQALLTLLGRAGKEPSEQAAAIFASLSCAVQREVLAAIRPWETQAS